MNNNQMKLVEGIQEAKRQLNLIINDQYGLHWNGIISIIEDAMLHLDSAELSVAPSLPPVSDGNSEAVAIPSAPKEIWLNIGDTDPEEVAENNWQWDQLSDVTWCQDKIDQCDIPYIRADQVPNYNLTASLQAENKRLLGALKEFQHAETCRQMGDFQAMHLALSEAFSVSNALISEIEGRK
jgi:hypothetical protein